MNIYKDNYDDPTPEAIRIQSAFPITIDYQGVKMVDIDLFLEWFQMMTKNHGTTYSFINILDDLLEQDWLNNNSEHIIYDWPSTSDSINSYIVNKIRKYDSIEEIWDTTYIF